MHKRTWLIGMAAAIVVMLGGAVTYLMAGQSAILRATVGMVDVASIADGTYMGEFTGWRWSNTMKVTVAAGSITAVEVVRDVAFTQPAVTEQLIQAVMAAQTLQVDGVSGATVTSTAYLKAMENALGQATKR